MSTMLILHWKSNSEVEFYVLSFKGSNAWCLPSRKQWKSQVEGNSVASSTNNIKLKSMAGIRIVRTRHRFQLWGTNKTKILFLFSRTTFILFKKNINKNQRSKKRRLFSFSLFLSTSNIEILQIYQHKVLRYISNAL